MPEKEPVLRTVTANEARHQLSPLLDQVSRNEQRVIVENHGTPVAAIVSVDDLERLRQLDERRRGRLEVLTKSWKAFEGENSDEIERKVTQVITEAREKQMKTRTHYIPLSTITDVPSIY